MKKLILIVGLSLLISPVITAQEQNNTVTTVFLIRHAEPYFPPYKEDPPDPSLNYAGQDRAKLLARMLSDIQINKIYSTDRKRTKETVTPLAEQKQLAIETYDLEGMKDLANTILTNTGTYLISGHSNTTPELVNLLGGDSGEPIKNSSEFDRVYMLVITSNGVLTYQLRYGTRYE